MQHCDPDNHRHQWQEQECEICHSTNWCWSCCRSNADEGRSPSETWWQCPTCKHTQWDK